MNANGICNAGRVRVFRRDRISRVAWMENDTAEERWLQIGTELEGDKEGDVFGAEVGLSSGYRLEPN